ncbi:MAG: DUF192 domain-containing protein, partial [bacterium]|nr:DUF192 domain-containing protein [bacterium]
LSGRASLADERGMLFVFSEPGLHRFRMPDMRFPIDIIWIAGGKVIGIEENISPEFDQINPRLYTPPEPAQYALEVNAGFSRNNNIGAGDKVILSSPDPEGAPLGTPKGSRRDTQIQNETKI